MRFKNVVLGLAIGFALGACSGPQSPSSAASRIADRETREMQPVVDRYKKQSVMGSEVKGTTLVLSVDAEGWSELDEPTDIAIRNAILDAWTRVWTKYHPREHAVLRLRVQNYYAQEITSQTKSI